MDARPGGGASAAPIRYTRPFPRFPVAGNGWRGASPTALQISTHHLAGARACLPVLPGVAAFGAISGVAMVGAGLSPWLAAAMSIIVFAGTAQLAALQLVAAGAPLGVVFLAGLILNLRFVLYSLSIAPHLGRLPRGARWLAAYYLSDNGYALAIGRIAARPHDPGHADYFMGACAAIWVTWQAATLAGIVVGAGIPAGWSLEFVVVLTFTALAVASVRDLAGGAAALAAGVTALAATGMPFRLGLIAAALAGVAAGLVADRWTR